MSKYALVLLFVSFLFNPANQASAAGCGSQNPSQCGDFTVCTLATAIQNGKRKWNTGNAYLAFLEAKKRGLSCSVGLSSSVAIDAKRRNTTAPNRSSYYAECSTTKDQLKNLQTVLKKLGLYSSVIDGVYGPGTEKAIRDGKRLLGAQASNGKCLSQEDVTALRLFSNNSSLDNDDNSANNDNSDTVLNELTAQNEKLTSENEALRGRVAILTATIAELSGSNASNDSSTILDLERTVAKLSGKLSETEKLLEAERSNVKALKQKSERARETLEDALTILNQGAAQNESNSIKPIQIENEVINPVNEEHTDSPEALIAKGVLSTAISGFTDDDAVRCYVGLRIIDRLGYRNAKILDIYLTQDEGTNSYIFSDFEMIKDLEIEPENFIFQVIDTSQNSSQEQSCIIVNHDPIKVIEQSTVQASTRAAYLREDGILIFTNFPVRPN